jgi:hypothetical protein
MLDPQLERAYRTYRYWVDVEPERFFVQIGQRSDRLAELLRAHGAAGCGFITAWNPHSQRVGRDANDCAQARLAQTLRDRRCAVLPGQGAAADGSWAEPMCVALGIDADTLAQLGRQFGQNAVVFCGRDAVPELIALV